MKETSVERLVDVYIEALFERDKLIRMRANLAADEYDKHVTPKILELEATIASRKAALLAHVEAIRQAQFKAEEEARRRGADARSTLSAAERLQAERDKLEQRNAELRALIRKYLDYLAFYCDEGPDGEGWKSNELLADIAAGEAAIATPRDAS